jgi:hypothetical protein
MNTPPITTAIEGSSAGRAHRPDQADGAADHLHQQGRDGVKALAAVRFSVRILTTPRS